MARVDLGSYWAFDPTSFDAIADNIVARPLLDDRQVALILPSPQTSIRGGAMPPASASGNTFIKLPVAFA